jgi:hypothetical protein
MTPTLYTSSMVYIKLTDEINMIQDTLDNLSLELEHLEDTWVESTPIINCLMTSIDVINHILKEKQGLRDTQARMIQEIRGQ